ncbi:hypothetical protein [Streptomyces shenzhenensis]|uniref:hypothetical protein n=1 Tax=Streptomyces shenzhenensis TaxID=943815 RepID=UPI0015F06350|nr:hypothetical protein [Streptomyces shenzhenensis]
MSSKATTETRRSAASTSRVISPAPTVRPENPPTVLGARRRPAARSLIQTGRLLAEYLQQFDLRHGKDVPRVVGTHRGRSAPQPGDILGEQTRVPPRRPGEVDRWGNYVIRQL